MNLLKRIAGIGQKLTEMPLFLMCVPWKAIEDEITRQDQEILRLIDQKWSSQSVEELSRSSQEFLSFELPSPNQTTLKSLLGFQSVDEVLYQIEAEGVQKIVDSLGKLN